MFLDVANRSGVLLLSGGILGEASVEQCLSRTLGSDFTRNNPGGLVEGGFFLCVCVFDMAAGRESSTSDPTA